MLAGGWAHACKNFHEAGKLHPQDQIALDIVARIDELLALYARPSADNLD